MKAARLLLGLAALCGSMRAEAQTGDQLSPECRGDKPNYSRDCLSQAWKAAMKVTRDSDAPGADPPAAPGAAFSKTVDLTPLIPGAESDPNKGPLGACHAFAAAALLNAAYLRQYGERVQFSPADILLQGTALLNPELAEERLYGGDFGGRRMMDTYYWEGGDIGQDLDIALTQGAAKAEHVPYNEFVPWYTHTLRPANDDDMARLDREGVLTRFLNLRQLVRDPESSERLVRGLRKSSAAEIDENRRRYARFLAGNGAQAESDRRESVSRFQGFRTASLFTGGTPGGAPSAAFCRAEGAGRAKAIVKELDAGRPVGVSIINNGADFAHAIVIDGYAQDKTGGLIFKTLNSWGPGADFPIPEEQLCHIMGVTALYVPRDGAAAP